ncbi:hypothetical protein HBH98_029270 [Parastagonospora nodorum]|nr:hypothetical protein HBI06_219070 [Parastagonospora nodorum]KAH4228781.1 hypothetical protein HBI05_202060 [Parastagonospora nodorum]KAH4309245.1 hypothetical protein HBI01_039480 [Parastagonospora nodorum]KAH4314539.1 hypothetical protein HBI02_059320 [Parastagonospora nodorum]KAH4335318.1 hypothetical protein HBI00_037640 [Parastagonospora nodorum]
MLRLPTRLAASWQRRAAWWGVEGAGCRGGRSSTAARLGAVCARRERRSANQPGVRPWAGDAMAARLSPLVLWFRNVASAQCEPRQCNRRDEGAHGAAGQSRGWRR